MEGKYRRGRKDAREHEALSSFTSCVRPMVNCEVGTPCQDSMESKESRGLGNNSSVTCTTRVQIPSPGQRALASVREEAGSRCLSLKSNFLQNNLSRLINSTTANQKQSLPVVSSRLPFSDLFSNRTVTSADRSYLFRRSLSFAGGRVDGGNPRRFSGYQSWRLESAVSAISMFITAQWRFNTPKLTKRNSQGPHSFQIISAP